MSGLDSNIYTNISEPSVWLSELECHWNVTLLTRANLTMKIYALKKNNLLAKRYNYCDAFLAFSNFLMASLMSAMGFS